MNTTRSKVTLASLRRTKPSVADIRVMLPSLTRVEQKAVIAYAKEEAARAALAAFWAQSASASVQKAYLAGNATTIYLDA